MFDSQAFYVLLIWSVEFCSLCGMGYVVVVSVSRPKRGLSPSNLEWLAFVLVATGSQFLIFGTVYVVTAQGFVATYSGSPWGVPAGILQPGPGETLTIDYSLNFLGAALMGIGSAVGIASWKKLRPHEQPMQPSLVDRVGQG